jgi:putative DNA methylase
MLLCGPHSRQSRFAMIERRFDIQFVAALALREKQIQQNYRPVIAVHKWFARRPGTLFRGILLSEFTDQPLAEAFYQGHEFTNLSILDPFMGGGTTLLEANRLGCAVTGFDVNPMSYWIVREEIESIDLPAYKKTAAKIRKRLEAQIGEFYRTSCVKCASPEAHVKYFLWVKTQPCGKCSRSLDLFPSYLVAEDVRHTANVFACWNCKRFFESGSRKRPGKCPHCGNVPRADLEARKGKCKCAACAEVNRFPNNASGPPAHRLFGIEYHCERCKHTHKGRFFKTPEPSDFANFEQAATRLSRGTEQFVPSDKIPPGDETERLHRWGYERYRDLFNARQLLGLELLCREISRVSDAKIRRALATNLSDLLRYQNMLCRYDTMALKSLDIFSIHGFPVGQIQCESNFLGISGKMGAIGSGGLLNILEKFSKAKAYCSRPFEIRHEGNRKVPIFIEGEWIGEERNGSHPLQRRSVNLCCANAMDTTLAPGSFDAVLTDPPYFGNVQYAELMDFCYVWLRKLVGQAEPAFANVSTRNGNELTTNVSMGRGFEHFAEGLSRSFRNVAKSLKAGSPMVFTYHHNKLEAYFPIALAILGAGLVCSASIPCPAEMGASIHISGTGSSIIDSVFVCRTTGRVPRKWLAKNADELAALICDELQQLREAGVKPTSGDVRCITYGHLIRLAVWNLRNNWEQSLNVAERTKALARWIGQFGGAESVQARVSAISPTQRLQGSFKDAEKPYAEQIDEIPF